MVFKYCQQASFVSDPHTNKLMSCLNCWCAVNSTQRWATPQAIIHDQSLAEPTKHSGNFMQRFVTLLQTLQQFKAGWSFSRHTSMKTITVPRIDQNKTYSCFHNIQMAGLPFCDFQKRFASCVDPSKSHTWSWFILKCHTRHTTTNQDCSPKPLDAHVESEAHHVGWQDTRYESSQICVHKLLVFSAAPQNTWAYAPNPLCNLRGPRGRVGIYFEDLFLKDQTWHWTAWVVQTNLGYTHKYVHTCMYHFKVSWLGHWSVASFMDLMCCCYHQLKFVEADRQHLELP